MFTLAGLAARGRLLGLRGHGAHRQPVCCPENSRVLCPITYMQAGAGKLLFFFRLRPRFRRGEILSFDDDEGRKESSGETEPSRVVDGHTRI
jgi:hypothetical protein